MSFAAARQSSRDNRFPGNTSIFAPRPASESNHPVGLEGRTKQRIFEIHGLSGFLLLWSRQNRRTGYQNWIIRANDVLIRMHNFQAVEGQRQLCRLGIDSAIRFGIKISGVRIGIQGETGRDRLTIGPREDVVPHEEPVFFLVYGVGFQFHDMFTGQSEQALQPFFRLKRHDREEIVHNAISFGQNLVFNRAITAIKKAFFAGKE